MSEEKPGVMYLSFEKGNIGIIGLKGLLELAGTREFSNEREIAEFLLEGVKKRNYVPPSCEEEYAAKLIKEYKKSMGITIEENEEPEFPQVKILGTSCARCNQLEQNTIEVLSEMGIVAELEHVSDPAEIGVYGVMATPAFVINRKVKSVGQVLNKEQIKSILNAELREKC